MNPIYIITFLVILVIFLSIKMFMSLVSGQKVEYYEMQRIDGKYEKVMKGVAIFLQFGSDNMEGGTFSTAIIKLPDGSLKNVDVEMIRFIDKGEIK